MVCRGNSAVHRIKWKTWRRELRQRIRSSQFEQQEALTAIDAARQMRQTAANALATLQEKRTLAAADCEKHHLARVWQAVLAVKPDKNKPDTNDWPDIEELKNKAEKTAQRLGITKAINSVEEAQHVHASLRQLTRRSSGLAAAFASEWTGKRAKWSAIIVVAAVVATVLAWPSFLKGVEYLLNISQGTLSTLLSPLLELGTAVSLVSAWAASRLNKISSALGYLERIRDEIRKPRVGLDKPTDQETRLKSEVEELDAKIATEQQKIKQADRQIADARRRSSASMQAGSSTTSWPDASATPAISTGLD